MTLRAVVIGTGWAGEGHTLALRATGVEVVALCGRTPAPAEAMAARLEIPARRFDWQQALRDLQPELVAIATSAAPHYEMAVYAAELGCHVLCDKPLAVNAQQAAAMLQAVEQAGVKHAYASTGRYAPVCLYAQQLVAEGRIGQVLETECIIHNYTSPHWAYNWYHSLEQGGGALNTILTHKLSQVTSMTGSRITAAAGESRSLLARAPIGPAIHDFRHLFEAHAILTPHEQTEWRAVTADLSCTLLVQLEMPDGHEAQGLFRVGGMATGRNGNYLALYGDQGTLHLHGLVAPNRLEHFDLETGQWQELKVPPAITAQLPQADTTVQRDWNTLVRAFVADIRGEGYSGYPTFVEGWQHTAIFDIVRSGSGWTPVPARPEPG
jgi:predicted dehydrogenase